MSTEQSPLGCGTAAVAPVAKIEGNNESQFQFVFGYADFLEADGLKIVFDKIDTVDDEIIVYYTYSCPNPPESGAKVISYPLPMQYFNPGNVAQLPTHVQVQNASGSKSIKKKILTSKPHPDDITERIGIELNSSENLNIPRPIVFANTPDQINGGYSITFYFILCLVKTNGCDRHMKTSQNLELEQILLKYRAPTQQFGPDVDNIVSYGLVVSRNQSALKKVTVLKSGTYYTQEIPYASALPFSSGDQQVS